MYVSMIVMNEKKNTMISIIVSQLLNCPNHQIKHCLPVNLKQNNSNTETV